MNWGAAQWDADCAAHLATLFTGEELAYFRSQIEAGDWLLLAGSTRDRRIASMVIGLGASGNGRVLMCYALAGNSTGRILDSATGFLVNMARDLGLASVCMETRRAGLVRHAERLGAQTRYVCELEVAENG